MFYFLTLYREIDMQAIGEELHLLHFLFLEMFPVLLMRPHSCTVFLVLLLYCTILTGALRLCVLPSVSVVLHSLSLFTYWFVC